MQALPLRVFVIYKVFEKILCVLELLPLESNDLAALSEYHISYHFECLFLFLCSDSGLEGWLVSPFALCQHLFWEGA